MTPSISLHPSQIPSPSPSTSTYTSRVRAARTPPLRRNASQSTSSNLQPVVAVINPNRHQSQPPLLTPSHILLSFPNSKLLLRSTTVKENIMFETKTDMSITLAQMTTALKATVKVVFEPMGQVSADPHGIVDMVGSANTGSSYSLPGHVIISIPAIPAGQSNKIRQIRELKLVVEGKSEFWDDSGRYTPVRLYSSTIDLAEGKELLIPCCDPLHPGAKRVELALAFDIRLPGWFPPSHRAFLTNTEYGLVVKSKIVFTEAAAPVYGQVRSVDKYGVTRTLRRTASLRQHIATMEEKHTSSYQLFNVHRHRLPSALNNRLTNTNEKSYNVKPAADSSSPIECVVTVPEWVDCYGQERDLKIAIRVRARRDAIMIANNKGKIDALARSVQSTMSEGGGAGTTLGEAGVPPTPDPRSTTPTIPPPSSSSIPMQREKEDEFLTRLLELGMEVEEMESYSSVPSQQYKSVYPIPDETEQPDRHSSHNALISPRSSKADVACTAKDDKPYRGFRSRKCLLAEDGSQRNFVFANDGLGVHETWRKVNVVLPMPTGQKGLRSRPQSEMDGPMLRIKHILKIRVVCRNVGSSGEDMAVVLSVPIQFGTSPYTIAANTQYPKPLLPAYVQLYHENGEQLPCDTLPIYRSADPTSPPPYTAPTQPQLPIRQADSSSSSSPSPRSSTSDVDILDLQTPTPSHTPPGSDDGHGSTSTLPAARYNNTTRNIPPWGILRPSAKSQPVPVVPTA